MCFHFSTVSEKQGGIATMRTIAQKQKPAQQARSTSSRVLDQRSLVRNHAVPSILPEANTEYVEGGPATAEMARFGHDFSRIPVYAGAKSGIQTKLEVNAAGDAYEQEADRVADAVMRVPGHGTPPAGGGDGASGPMPPGPGVQKIAGRKPIEDEEDVPPKKLEVNEKCNCGEDDKLAEEKVVVQRREDSGAAAPRLEPGIETRIQGMRGGGQPLPSSERRFMEPRFGADFGSVRVHTDQEADSFSRAIHARAFTLGSDIFFRAGEYAPERPEGRRLLAHELTHSIQQGAARTHPMNDVQIGARSTVLPTLQRQGPAPPGPAPPAPAPPAPAPPAGRATLNFLPILHDQAPTGWGVTVNDDPVFDITAYASGATWKCVITTADQQSHQGTRLLPGVVEVTPALVAGESSCATLQTMITSLDTVANQGTHSGYYMLAAVQAHEDVHITQYRTGLAPHYTTLKTAIEALTVPLASQPDATAAKAAIKALPAYTTAMATFHTADVAVNNASGRHTPVAPFNTAEHGVVDPMIATIRARRTTLKCAP